jgi:hypothetical protein
MTARINLNLLPEQQLYLEHLIKELSYNFAWYQEASAKDRQSSTTERYWKAYRQAEDLLKSEFGIKNL